MTQVPSGSNVAGMQTDSFRRPWWLFSGHMETIASLYERNQESFENRVIPTPEGDEILLSYVMGDEKMPLLTLFHGLEGCAQSHTIRLLASYFIAQGWTVAVPHFRSCGHMNRLPRAYHAADGAEVRWMLNWCRAAFVRPYTFAAGVSLGGNALIRCLDSTDETESCCAAATVSAPLDLTAAAYHLNSGFPHLLYGRHFLKLLRAKVLVKAARYPSICDLKKLRRARTIGDFDELYTAPVHGFSSAQAYWRRASAYTALLRMKTPLLCINAQNDPMVPVASLPVKASSAVSFCRPRHGGHGAFFGKPANWLAATMGDFFNQYMNS